MDPARPGEPPFLDYAHCSLCTILATVKTAQFLNSPDKADKAVHHKWRLRFSGKKIETISDFFETLIVRVNRTVSKPRVITGIKSCEAQLMARAAQ